MMMEVEDSCLGSEGRGVMSGRPGGVEGGSTGGKMYVLDVFMYLCTRVSFITRANYGG